MLSNFQLGDQALLQSFLVGQPELRTMMQGPDMQQLRQRVIASYHLGPMDRRETEAYVEHRLTHVGWKGDPRFDDGALDLVYQGSGGVPRRINTLCNRLLLAGCLGEKHVLGAADVEAIMHEVCEELGSESMSGNLVAHPRSALEPVKGAGALIADARVTAQLKQIDERLSGIERTMATAIRLLQHVLEPNRVGSKPRTPAGR